tara:strand:+ start:14781 stop:15854 length:1074 start_codon:yes stop_codon:yes gene_type:complete
MLQAGDRSTKVSIVETDDVTREVGRYFDYSFDGTSTFTSPPMPDIPEDFGIGLIVGPSGSGKTTLLQALGSHHKVHWNPNKAVASHFQNIDDAIDRLSAVGFSSIPSWMRPYQVLSTGEKFRADLARRLGDGAIIDEFTSVVDRNVAKAASNAIRRYVSKQGVKRMVFASCHYDICEWLQPDWIFDTSTEKYSARGWERPSIEIRLIPCGREAWPMFSHHHYLDSNINKSSRCWLAYWQGMPVGFASVISFPSGSVKRGWRGHRTVVLPDFQGLGIGMRISDAMGEMVIRDGGRYFSKTAHPRMGAYREASDLWRPTSKNKRKRKDYLSNRETKESGHKLRHAHRLTYSHEYMGSIV